MIEHLHPKVHRPNIKDTGAILFCENHPRFLRMMKLNIHGFRAQRLRENKNIERNQSSQRSYRRPLVTPEEEEEPR